MLPVTLSTFSRDLGAGSRMLVAAARLLAPSGVAPFFTVGGRGALREALIDLGAKVATLSVGVRPSGTWPWPFAVAVGQLCGRLMSTKAAVVHLNEHESYPVVSRAARLVGVPAICHVRFEMTREMAQWLFKPPYTPARLIFNSETLRRSCEPALEGLVPRERSRVILNGLDYEMFGRGDEVREGLRRHWGIGQSTVAVGSACAISDRKRLDHFVRLIAALRAAGCDVVGFHAGRPHFPSDAAVERELHRLAASLGLGDAMRFLGHVDDIEPLYHAWDIFVSTSRLESFGMSVLEAMACACAVVGYPAESLPEVVGPAGLLVEDNNLGALVGACERLVRDRHRREALAHAAARRARQEFDIRDTIAALAREYVAVAAERRREPPVGAAP